MLQLKILVSFTLFLEFAFGDGLGPVELGLFGGKLHVESI